MQPLPNDSLIHVVNWSDPVVERSGYRVDDRYVEMFWLPILGPTATWLLRRMAGGLFEQPDGYAVDLHDLAHCLGVSYASGKQSPFARALQRCVMFGVSQQVAIVPQHTLAVRTVLPRLSQRHLSRLSDQLVTAHGQWPQPADHLTSVDM